MTQDRRERQSLYAAALGLIGESATAGELLTRLTGQRAALSEERTAEMLDHLASLGLVRVISAEGDRRYGLTSLGVKAIEATVGAETLTSHLAELENLRSDLLSTVSHELRTPLTALRTCVGLLLDPATHPDEAETRQLLETIERNADRMQRLVSDVLDLARYRTGNIQLERRRFDAREIAESSVAAVTPLASAHRQAFIVAVPESPVWIYADHRRLEQALLNLVANAQKYSPDGAIIDVTLKRGSEGVEWEVVDQGPGISEEDQKHLFERFFVGRSDTSERRAGVGLGLPTALAIAQAHGGRIRVSSLLGEGSRFSLVVPTHQVGGEEG